MKAMGVVPGISDLIYLSSAGPVFIEMKTEAGIQSPEQNKFQQIVEGLGYQYIICRSFEKFQEIINGNPAKPFTGMVM